MITSMAKEAGNASIASNNRAYSNRGSRKDGYSDDMPSTKGRECTKKLLCHRCKQEREKELLQLWRIQTYGKTL